MRPRSTSSPGTRLPECPRRVVCAERPLTGPDIANGRRRVLGDGRSQVLLVALVRTGIYSEDASSFLSSEDGGGDGCGCYVEPG
jgi:hypothetical protein